MLFLAVGFHEYKVMTGQMNDYGIFSPKWDICVGLYKPPGALWKRGEKEGKRNKLGKERSLLDVRHQPHSRIHGICAYMSKTK